MSGVGNRWRKARDGEVFHKASSVRGVAVHTSGERREIIEGPISARIVKSEKFGWELQFNIYTRKGGERIEIRNPSKWNRIEYYIPLNEENTEVIKWLEELLEKVKESRRWRMKRVRK